MDSVELIKQGFEISDLVGYLVVLNVLFVGCIIWLYKDRNKAVDLYIEIAKDSIKAVTIVTESQNAISSLSSESLQEVRMLKESVIKNSCKYVPK